MRFAFVLFFLWGTIFGASFNYFLGTGIDFASTALKVTSKVNLDKQEDTIMAKSYVAILNAGVQQYWDQIGYVGGRAGVEFGIGGADIKSRIAGVFAFSASLDLLIDFFKQDFSSIGIFGGFEYGMTFLVSKASLKDYKIKSETYGAYWRFGASVTLEKIHRVDLTYKAPVAVLAFSTEKIGQIKRDQTYSGAQFSLEYKFLF